MKQFLIFLGIITGFGLLSACSQSGENETVSFSKDVKPILAEHCISCHNPEGEGYKKSGLNLESYSTLMKGTKFGPVITPGEPLSSSLVLLIDGKADPAITMPHGSLQLIPKKQRDTIKQWIAQGAKDN
ncbi:MAG: hypothetical protein PVJ39_12740 [Gammaproteobacteria bacterium]|jgi:hypothetical protein